MANERMYPILPCKEIDDAIAFYESIEFTRTYRQSRPNPHAVVAREDMHIHLFGMPEFDPAQSYGRVCIASCLSMNRARPPTCSEGMDEVQGESVVLRARRRVTGGC